MSRKHILITGGLGFIGSHVADAYLAAGARVTLVDSEVSSVTNGLSYETHAHCTVVRSSIEEYLVGGGTFQGVDRVIHAASPVGPAGILKQTGRLGAAMVHTGQRIIEACLQGDVPLCVFSSAEVYNRSGLLAEDDFLQVPVPYNTRIEYAVAKTLLEVMTANSCRRGLRAIVVRPFNVAGPRQSRAGGFVLPTFVQQARAGQALTVFGNGQQIRAFLAARDLAYFLVEFMDAALQRSEPIIYNIANPANAITIRGLAELVRSLAGSPSDIVYIDGRTVHGPLYAEAVSEQKIPVLGQAIELGWRPRVGLEELVRQTICYYETHQDFRAVFSDVPQEGTLQP